MSSLSKKSTDVFITAIVVLLASIGVSLQAGTEHSRKSAGAVYFGGLFNLKGLQSVLDIPSANGAQLAVDQINATGGLIGKRVELIVEDGESRPKKLTKSTEKILRQFPSVSAFLGLSV